MTNQGYFSSTVLCNKYVLILPLNILFETFRSIFNSNIFHDLKLIFESSWNLYVLSVCYYS